MHFQDFTLDRLQQRLMHNGQTVHLEPQAWAVLTFLVDQRARVVTKSELMAHCWQDKIVTEASLTNEIRLIRKALGDNGRDQRLIRTVHGQGYQFVGATTDPSANAVPSELPTRPRNTETLLGRERDMHHLIQKLAQPEPVFITLLGPGGMGKTTLARAVEEQSSDLFPDGIWFINLLAAHDTHGALEQIVQTLNLGHALPADTLETQTLAEHIGVLLSGKRCLLIMDNAEHIPDVADAVQIIHLQGGASILTTSRERLCLSTEYCYDLDGLSCESVSEEPSDAATLFIKRTRLQVGDAVLSRDDQQAIEQICKAIGGMPLAIELAAAWLRYLPLADLKTEILKSLSWLDTDLRDIPQRHRSAAALFEWSWTRLTRTEQFGMARMALFPTGFNRDLCKSFGRLTTPELATLERCGLIRLRDDGIYSIHELVRQLTLEKLHELSDADAVLDELAWLLTCQSRYLLHSSYYRQLNEHTEAILPLLLQAFEIHADLFIKRKMYPAILIFLELSLRLLQNSRKKTRIIELFIPVLKDQLPLELYMSLMMEKILFQIWQHHADIQPIVNQILNLLEALPEIETTYRARLSAGLSQLYQVNEQFEDAEIWAEYALSSFEATEFQASRPAESSLTDYSCLIWTYNNIGQPDKALIYCDLELQQAYQNNPYGIWYGGFSFKAWTLAHMGLRQQSHFYSGLLFNEALKRGDQELLSIWTIQAAQVAEHLGEIGEAAEFFALSEYYLRQHKNSDLVESIRTREVLSFMGRLKTALGDADYQALILKWQGQSPDQVNSEALAAFENACGSTIPPLESQIPE